MSYTVTEGSGSTFAADVVGAASAPAATQKIPYVKVDLGGNGASLPMVGGAQNTANSMPTSLATDQKLYQVFQQKQTQTTTIGAYTAGMAVGGKITFTGAGRASGSAAELLNIHILDKDNQKAALTILFFDSDPTGATLADHTAFVFGTSNVQCIGKIDVPTTAYTTINSQAVANLDNIVKLLVPNGSANLFAAVITTGTPTYASTSSVVVTFNFSQQ